MKRLSGKTALVTGCNRGIGKAIAEKFASEGANLICAVRDIKPAFEAEIAVWRERFGVEVNVVCFDLANEQDIKEVFKALNREKRVVDILVNNAAVPAGGLLLMTPTHVVKDVMQVNFFSQVLITQLAAKMMVKQKHGAIVNISSVTALDNQAGWTAYGGSKAAMISLTHSAASELAAFGIRVNAVAPGLIDTEMGRQMDERCQAEMLSRSCLKRKGTPEEVANLVCFLASDEASYITGQLIRIDGGM